jgi:hypothetical protein
MFVLDSLLVGSLRFVLDKIAHAVDEEMNNPDRLRQELLEAQMRHELGEIDDAELARIEAGVLANLRALRQERGPITFSSESGGVELDFDAGDEPDRRA